MGSYSHPNGVVNRFPDTQPSDYRQKLYIKKDTLKKYK